MTAGVDSIYVEGRSTKVFKVSDPAEIDWSLLGARIVIESMGPFTKGADARKHLHGTVKKVIISAPSTEPDLTIVASVLNQKLTRSAFGASLLSN